MADLRVKSDSYHQCVVAEAVRLGAENTESAQTVLLAVASICRDREVALREAYARTPISELRVAALIERDREKAQQDAVAALLEARAR